MTSAGDAPRAPQAEDSGFPSTTRETHALEMEYEALITAQLRRFGIDRTSVALEVWKVGEMRNGLDAYAGMIQIRKWDRVSALRLLLGLPMLEAKVRQSVGMTWLADLSHFSGLWLNTSHDLHREQGTGELRELIVQLAPPRRVPRPAEPDLGNNAAARTIRKLLGESPVSPAHPAETRDEPALTNP
jgi:hypothetical protein